jgi:hypothetical protein
VRTPSPTPASPLDDHQDLLERARRARAHATAGAHALLRDDLDELIPALLAHLEQERALIARLPTFSADVLRRGQERLVDRLVRLDVEADSVPEEPTSTSCGCLLLATELDVLLRLQGIDERRLALAGATGPG